MPSTDSQEAADPQRQTKLQRRQSLLRLLCQIRTSKQWSTLPAILTKLHKLQRRLHPNEVPFTPRAVSAILSSTSKSELLRHGIWVTFFGAKYMPIVLTNQGYAQQWSELSARHDNLETGKLPCTCRFGKALAASKGAGNNKDCVTSGMRKQREVARYFGSHDYNAGRHCATTSEHHSNCLCWHPPTSGHLHSWRRGYEK